MQWLDAGQTLLRRGGIGAVKLQALAKQTGRTTGSFYHHFGSMQAYIDELARYYGAEQVRDHLATLRSVPPLERIGALTQMALDLDLVPLDAAMRDWAGSNELAAEAVRGLDSHLFSFLEQAFVDLGFDAPQARLRAHLLLAIGVARLTPPWPRNEVPATHVLELLTA